MTTQKLPHHTIPTTEAIITDIAKALDTAGNPVIGINVSYDKEDNAPIIEVITNNAVIVGSQQATVVANEKTKDKIAGTLDVDLAVVTAHVHGDVEASHTQKTSVTAPAPKVIMDPETKKITVTMGDDTMFAKEAQPMHTMVIDPHHMDKAQMQSLDHMAAEGFMGKDGPKLVKEATDLIHSVRPDLAQEQQHSHPQPEQAQRSARTNKEDGLWVNVIKPDAGAREAGRSL
ncbi:MAG: hypothetical protein EAY65_02335 [Alphaproteobacteria bacterium]|nr:MAG: hypothetical protein EAY65_02335 [Alphaproteobacteria bacterium]